MRSLGSSVAKTGTRMGKALKGPLTDGFKSAKDAASGMLSTLKGAVSTVVTLGGALSAAGLVKSAVEAETAYIQLAGQLSESTGAAIDQADAQALVERVVKKTKGSLDEARASLRQLAGVGDLDKIEDSMERTAFQAKRLGVETDLVGRATSRVLAKGIAKSAEEAELLLERMSAFGRTVLGVDPDEAIDPNDIAEFSSFVNRTNSGVEDMIFLLGKSANQVKDMGSAFVLIEELGELLNTKEGLKTLRKESRGATKDLSLANGAVENLFQILETGDVRAIEALRKGFSAMGKASLSDLLGGQLEMKIGSGEVTEQEIKDFAKNLREEMGKAGENLAIQNRIQKTNAELLGTSGANFQDALNKVEIAFSKPQMLAAIDRLADKLPALAEEIANIVDFIAEKPLQAALIALGARIALAAAGGFGGAAAKGVAGAVGGRFAAAQAASKAVQTAALGGGATVALGKTGAGAVLAGKAGLGAAATGAAGVAAAGAAGFFGTRALLKATGGEEAIERFFADFNDKIERAQTRGVGDPAAQKKMTEQTERGTKAMEKLAAATERAAKSAGAGTPGAVPPRGVLKPPAPKPGDAMEGVGG